MEPGTSVRLIADLGSVRVTTGRSRSRCDTTYGQVRFPDRAGCYQEINLDVITDQDEDHLELLRNEASQ